MEKGRPTSGRAALAGAATSAWFGLLTGLLLGLVSSGSSGFRTLAGSAALGAAWWALFAFLADKATRGRHDFTRAERLETEQYDVTVDTGHADDAIRRARML